jgi:hypothetical protein
MQWYGNLLNNNKDSIRLLLPQRRGEGRINQSCTIAVNLRKQKHICGVAFLQALCLAHGNGGDEKYSNYENGECQHPASYKYLHYSLRWLAAQGTGIEYLL